MPLIKASHSGHQQPAPSSVGDGVRGRVGGGAALQQLLHVQPGGAAVPLQRRDHPRPVGLADANVLVHVRPTLSVRPLRRNMSPDWLLTTATARGG
jgi:hypothetical protein